MKTVERLRGPRVFEAVRTGGKVLDGQFLRFFYVVDRAEHTPIAFGIVIGKRHGSAVLRNRIKRRIRAASREVLGSLAPMLKGKGLRLSVVIVFKSSRGRSPALLSYAEIRDDTASLAQTIQPFVAEIDGTRAGVSHS